MKPIISKTDYETIKSAMLYLSPLQKTREVHMLGDELYSGIIVSDNEIASDVIRLNSYFEIQEEKSDRVMKFKLTLPDLANLTEKKISVLSPLGIALIGFKQGMTVECTLPTGNKKFKIIKVQNQAGQVVSDIDIAQ